MTASAPHVLLVTLAGSQAHGTAREGSDVDLRGVYVASLSKRLSLRPLEGQLEGPLPDDLAREVLPRLAAHPTASRALAVKLESVLYDVAKFVALAAEANPNALEILFADERDWLHEGPGWRILHDTRHAFLTKKVQQTFLGYGLAQLRRIQSHRAWLLAPPKDKPTREAYGLPAASGTLSRDDQNRIEESIAARLRSYAIDDLDMPKPTRLALRAHTEALLRDALSMPDEELEPRLRAVATHALHLPAEVVSALNAEKKYRAAMKHWESYQSWKSQRNPARAELERRHGYDTKHAMHLVRLMRTGLEVLERGELLVRRPDADELAAIRDGALSFDALLALARALEAAMERAARTTRLPDDVDPERVDRVVYALATARSA